MRESALIVYCAVAVPIAAWCIALMFTASVTRGASRCRSARLAFQHADVRTHMTRGGAAMMVVVVGVFAAAVAGMLRAI